jgi:recombinational DNA repair ATPase RecF
MSELTELVGRRLDEDGTLDASVHLSVRRALDAVEGAEGEPPNDVGAPTGEDADTDAAGGVYLDRITVRSFRGIGPETHLEIPAGPGLTVVSGRNGSGKSSFAEALEVALTGTTYRWRNRSAQWQGPWRNLHCDAPPRVEVQLQVDGGNRALLVNEWASDDFDSRSAALTGDIGVGSPLWESALETFRPLLTYEELGQVLSARPSELYDALSTVLGLSQLTDAIKHLDSERKRLEEPARALKQARGDLLTVLRTHDDGADQRITQAVALLMRTVPDAAALRTLATGTEGTPGAGITTLRALASMNSLDAAAADAAASELRAAVASCAQVADETSVALRRRLTVIRAALTAHQHDGDMACPVCGVGILDAGRASILRAEADDADAALGRLASATSRLDQARAAARAVIRRVPVELSAPADAAVERVRGVALRAWREWADAPHDDLALADHIATHLPRLATAVAHLRAAAASALTARDDSWAPLASRLGSLADLADDTAAAKPDADSAKAALNWLKANDQALKNERLAPISEHAARIWELLRQESNVEIAGLSLAGTATRRRVTIEATVDGADASGIAVLSQGELHALSLALFLPRATMDASPFRFVVLDDPVQAMDPAKVDGLVEVLAEIAETRQVVVFSHDDRLAAAVRRSSVRATVLEVTRGASSVVNVVNTYTPSRRFLQDARALCKDPGLPAPTLRKVLPGMLRMAVEAAARDRYFAAALASGVPHRVVEREWERAHRTRERIGLAVGGSATTWSQELGHGYRRAALGVAGAGVHDGLQGSPESALDAVRKTIEDLVGGIR